MQYSLILIGAHNGSKTKSIVEWGASVGQVLLIEPVPWLFASLVEMYAGNPAITLLSAAISETDRDEITFFAPKPNANSVEPYGDQLGSLERSHAIDHNPQFSDAVEEITTRAISLSSLFAQYEIEYIDTLITDTEGYDARILAAFPFRHFRPRQIMFEFKHSDGTFHIGQRLAHLLVILEAHGYRTRVIDAENCIATRVD